MNNNTTVKTLAQTSGILMGAFSLLEGLPQPYATYASYILMALGIIGLIGTRIPAPAEGSKWTLAYKVLSILSSNWGEAINESQTLRGKK